MSTNIAIDVGSSNLRAAVELNGRVELLLDKEGERATRACISLRSGESRVGKENADPSSMATGLKHMVGKSAADFQVPPGGMYFDDTGLPVLRVVDGAKPTEFYPQELLALMLEEIKTSACTRLGALDVSAVITVPSFFGLSERQAILEAANLAGLTVLQLLNASTAAAIAYAANSSVDGQRNIVVVDIGGGDLDACVASVDSGKVDVVASTGVEQLGGERLTMLLLDYVVREIQSQHGIDLSKKPRTLRRIEKECEKTKKLLSSAQRARIQLEIDEDIEYVKEIRRDCFEGLGAQVVEQITTTLATMLKTSGLERPAINEVVLVGGSSRVPVIRETISRLFGDAPVNTSLNVDEAVVMGAAHLAASLDGSASPVLSRIVVEDILTQSLRISIGSENRLSVPVATRLPHRYAVTMPEVNDDAVIQVYEVSTGRGNRSIGNYRVKDVGPFSASESFELVSDINESGVLDMSLIRKPDQREAILPSSAADFTASGGNLFVELGNGRVHKVNQFFPAEKLPLCPVRRMLAVSVYERQERWMRQSLTWTGRLYISVPTEQIPFILVHISATTLGQVASVVAHCTRKAPTLVREPDARSLTSEQLRRIDERRNVYRSVERQRSVMADARNELHEKVLAFERLVASKGHVYFKASEVNQVEELRRKIELVLSADASVEKYTKYIKRLAQWTNRVNELEAAREAVKFPHSSNQFDAAHEVSEDVRQLSAPVSKASYVGTSREQNAVPLEDRQPNVALCASVNLEEQSNYWGPADRDISR